MSKIFLKVAIVLSLLVVLSACADRNDLDGLPSFTQRSTASDPGQPVINITYTGTAGALLQVGRHAIMLDPYFSNHGLFSRNPFAGAKPNKKIVDALLPDISSVSGIVIGHAHLDHLLDAPYVLSKAPARAKIFGSATASNIIASLVEASRRVELNEVMATSRQSGSWVTLPDAFIRIMAIQSEHAPHFGSTVLAGGRVEQELERVPSAWGWQAGQPLTYLIDFLKEPIAAANRSPEILYRIFWQSSASGPLYAPPSEVLAEHPVDLALLCVANFTHVTNYPEHVIEAVKPDNIMLIHWDNLFKSRLDRDVEPLPFLDVAEFVQRASAAMGGRGEILMPMPGTAFALPIPHALAAE